MNGINDVLNINNSNNAWDSLDRLSKFNLLRQALHNGVVDVSIVKRMYNNKVLEDYDNYTKQLLQYYQQQELELELSQGQLQDIYNMVEGNPQQYCRGGFINKYDEGTSLFNTQSNDVLLIQIPLYIMPMPILLELKQLEIDYDKLENWMAENFNNIGYNYGVDSDLLTLPLRHRQLVRSQVKPSITESNVFKDLAIQQEYDSIREDKNLYKKGGNTNKKNSGLSWRLKADIDRIFSMSTPIYIKDDNDRKKKIRRERNKKYYKEHPLSTPKDIFGLLGTPFEDVLYDKGPYSKLIRTYEEKGEDALKQIQPELDELFPDKNIQYRVLDYLRREEKNLPIKVPEYSMATRLIDLYKLSNRPKLYSPSKNWILKKSEDIIPKVLWNWNDEQTGFNNNVLRPMTIPRGKSLIFSSLLPTDYSDHTVLHPLNTFTNFDFAGLKGSRTRDIITTDENILNFPLFNSGGISGYVDKIILEIPHAYINANPDDLLEYGMNGRSFVDTLINLDEAYNKKGTFEYNTHSIIEPILRDYLYFRDLDYKNMSSLLLNKSAYEPFNVNKIINNQKAKDAIKYTEYIPSDLSLEYDLFTGLGLDLLHGVTKAIGRRIPSTNISDKDIEDFYKNYVREPYRIVTNPKYTWKNYLSPALNNLENAIEDAEFGSDVPLIIGPGKHFADGGNKNTAKKKRSPTWQYTGKKDLVIPKDMSPYEALRLIGVPFNPNTLSGYIRPLNAKFGVKNSFHKRPWKGSKRYGSAVDLTPAPGYTYDDILRALAHPALLEWARVNGYGILDERPASVRARTNATGPHLHFGPDKGATKIYSNTLISPHYSYWDSIGMPQGKSRKKSLSSWMMPSFMLQSVLPQYNYLMGKKNSIREMGTKQSNNITNTNYYPALKYTEYPFELLENYLMQQAAMPRYQPVYTPIMLPYLFGGFNDYNYTGDASALYLYPSINYDYLMPYLLNVMSYLPFMNYFGNA